MIDEKKTTANLKIIQGKLLGTADKLLLLDRERLRQVKQFLSQDRMSDDIGIYREFVIKTQESLNLLTHFQVYYEQILAYVLLLEASGHRSELFRDLYGRYQLMGKYLANIIKIRETEMKLLSSIINPGFFSSFFSVNPLRHRLEKISQIYIKKEFLLVRIIIGIAEKNGADGQVLKKRLETEAKKEKALLSISVAVWFVPVVGTALSVISVATLTWLNEFSKNYQQLSGQLR